MDHLRERLEASINNCPDSQRVDWAAHPLTRVLHDYIVYALEVQKNTWATGGFTAETQDGTLQQNSAAIGKCDALLEMDDFIRQIGGTEKYD